MRITEPTEVTENEKALLKKQFDQESERFKAQIIHCARQEAYVYYWAPTPEELAEEAEAQKEKDGKGAKGKSEKKDKDAEKKREEEEKEKEKEEEEAKKKAEELALKEKEQLEEEKKKPLWSDPIPDVIQWSNSHKEEPLDPPAVKDEVRGSMHGSFD